MQKLKNTKSMGKHTMGSAGEKKRIVRNWERAFHPPYVDLHNSVDDARIAVLGFMDDAEQFGKSLALGEDAAQRRRLANVQGILDETYSRIEQIEDWVAQIGEHIHFTTADEDLDDCSDNPKAA